MAANIAKTLLAGRIDVNPGLCCGIITDWIVEDETHDALMARGGIYAGLHAVEGSI